MAGSEPVPDTHTILEQINDGFLQVDAHGRILAVNAAATRTLAHTDLVGKSLWAEFTGLEDSEFGRACRRALETGEAALPELPAPAFGPQLAGRAYPFNAGLSIYLRRLTEQAGESEHWMQTLAEAVPCAVVLTRWESGAFLYTNQHLRDLIGFSSEEEALTHFAPEFYVYPPDRDALLEAVASHAGVYYWEGRYCRTDGAEFWLSGAYKSMTYQGEQVLLAAFQDTTETRRYLEEAWNKADHDSLTGLFNHRVFYKNFDDLAALASAENRTLAVVLLDLDGFKFFNDAYGHTVGDEVLRHVAAHLRNACGTGDVLARFGGDEFALLLPEAERSGTENAEAASIAARLETALSGLAYTPPGYETAIPITLSLGVALFPGDAAARQDIMPLAGERLRRAKTGAVPGKSQKLREALQTEIAGFTMLDALVTAVDNKDRYTRRHSEDVMQHSVQIAQALGLEAAALRSIETAALLHDVGKIGVPDAVLRKPGKLSDEEYEAVKLHAGLGAIFVSAVPGLEGTLDAVRHHHERWDGGGYPFGLRGDQTPLPARIMAVADAFSAMTTDRPYRRGMDAARALAILEEGAGTQWDPDCVRAFVSVSGPDPAGEASPPRRP